jgi:serine/threonine protein kinase
MSEPEPEPHDGAPRPRNRIGKYEFGDEPISYGFHGNVYTATDTETGEEVALKLALEQRGTPSQLYEVMCHQACQAHEFVVPIKDILYDRIEGTDGGAGFTRQKQLAVVMEKMGGGALYDEVTSKRGMSEDDAKLYFTQILLAMAHVHAQGVAHGDMKLQNLLLTESKDACKVCDFGLAKYVTDDAFSTSRVKNPEYTAPEVLTNPSMHDATKADMWACGVVLYCMVECHFPFDSPDKAAAAEFSLRAGRSEGFVELLERLLSPDVGNRYSAAEALEHPWLVCEATRGHLSSRELEACKGGDERLRKPGNYLSRSDWEAQVKKLTGDPDEGESDDDPEGF